MKNKIKIVRLAWRLFMVDTRRTKRFKGVGTWQAMKIVVGEYQQRADSKERGTK